MTAKRLGEQGLLRASYRGGSLDSEKHSARDRTAEMESESASGFLLLAVGRCLCGHLFSGCSGDTSPREERLLAFASWRWLSPGVLWLWL